MFVSAQRDRSTAGSRDVLGAVGEQLQSGIEVARGHFSQRVWCEVWEGSRLRPGRLEKLVGRGALNCRRALCWLRQHRPALLEQPSAALTVGRILDR